MIFLACGAAIAQALLPPVNPGPTTIPDVAIAATTVAGAATTPSDMDDTDDDDMADATVNGSSPSTNPSTSPSRTSVASTQSRTQSFLANGNNNRRNNRNGRNGRNGRTNGFATNSTQPSTMAAGAMSPDYYVLATRNVFIKGRQIVNQDGGAGSGDTRTYVPQPDALILNGVIFTDQGVVALIEDISAAQTTIVQAGDTIGPGKIVDITLDYLDYEADGKDYRVTIGQNLYGGSSVASTQPSGTATPADVDSMIKKLQLKRQEEERGLR
jgi:hypothetical protein